MGEYYDGTKLLSLKDINKKRPEIYICTSNRSAGKTTYFNRLVVNRFLKKQEKFMLLYRFNYELDNISDKFFKDIQALFFKGLEMSSKPFARRLFHELFIGNGVEKIPCGYAVSLNAADQLKKYSHYFSDISCIVFDEFQSEVNKYCPEEITKFISVHTSVARGNGEMTRYVPVYMISNPVSMINPYYTAMGISSRLDQKTRFLKGNGFVMEQGYNKAASEAQKQSAFNQAFASADYIAYSSQGVYLNDNTAFIEKPSGKNRYIATLKYKDKNYALREYQDLGIIYCDNRADMTYPYRVAVTTDDHQINYVMLRSNEQLVWTMRWYFERGCFRFRDLASKEALLNLISY